MSESPRISRQTTPIHIRAVRELLPAPIPRPLTSFVDRERERAEIAALLTHDQTRLVSLVGPAGVGKTRLAIQVTTDVSAHFAIAGFASLAAITEPKHIVSAAGDALGVREPTIERISDQLGTTPALLVLDNFEQIPGPASMVALLLAACASLVILATSRIVLHVSGEHVYQVLPFATAPEPLDGTPAIQLFAARALEADPAFDLDAKNTALIAQICHRVDGLPLAIELAAGQVRLLTPREILDRLDQRFDLLTHGPEDQPERQHDLERAIRWSYDLLSATEQRAFRRLGVFAGGFSEDAARQIALENAGPALPLLASLLDASLLIRSVQPDGESRYALLETIRAFCLLELRACGEEAAARAAHAAYYLTLAARAEPRLIVIGSAEWVCRLAVEQANLRDAVDWSLDAGEPEPVLRLAGTLLSVGYARGEPTESLSWLERAIAMAGSAPAPLVSDALFTASALAQVQGDFGRSVDFATRSLELARAAGYAFGEGRALLGLGISAEWTNDLDLAETRYRDARAIMQTIDPASRLSHWCVLPVANLADIALFRGHYREAIELGSEAVAAWRDAGYLWGIAQALGTVAAARCELGDLDGARHDYRETLDLWIACADGRGIAGTVAGIAAIAAHSRDSSTAAMLLGAAWTVRATLGIEYVTHHLYAEHVRTAIFRRFGSDAHLTEAEMHGRNLSFDDAISVARQVLMAPGRPTRPPAPIALSAREREVLACIAEGMHDREIAGHLSISPRTVQSHVLGILNKLGARSRPEAVAIALRNGLL